jgi:tRNA(Arg) A34 adenosine deaminase TadA
MCSDALVWVNLGMLVYGACDIDLCQLIGEDGSMCSKLVFDRFSQKGVVRSGVLKNESIEILVMYFQENNKD